MGHSTYLIGIISVHMVVLVGLFMLYCWKKDEVAYLCKENKSLMSEVSGS